MLLRPAARTMYSVGGVLSERVLSRDPEAALLPAEVSPIKIIVFQTCLVPKLIGASCFKIKSFASRKKGF